MLRVCFYNGTGKPPSLPVTQSWFVKAAKQGNVGAIKVVNLVLNSSDKE